MKQIIRPSHCRKGKTFIISESKLNDFIEKNIQKKEIVDAKGVEIIQSVFPQKHYN